MAHNLTINRHRYVYVVPAFVRPQFDASEPLIPAIWFGMSVTPGRSLGCHVVLEDGAMVVDLPLHALRWSNTHHTTQLLTECALWDGFGFDAEVYAPTYMDEMAVRILDADHKMTDMHGRCWFAIDYKGDGYSMEPAQHKLMWVVAVYGGWFVWVPQDMLLVDDTSFTEISGVPRVKRQSMVWRAE